MEKDIDGCWRRANNGGLFAAGKIVEVAVGLVRSQAPTEPIHAEYTAFFAFVAAIAPVCMYLSV